MTLNSDDGLARTWLLRLNIHSGGAWVCPNPITSEWYA